jgi:hypothetical protein
MQRLTPEAPEAAEGAPEPMEEVVEKTAGGEAVTTSPEIALEVAVRSPEIQDAEPIRSAPMTEATASSRGRIELLDAAFAKYHNDVMELQAKGDDLVWKNKGLRNKNKGTPLNLSGTCWRSRSI